MNIFGSCMGFLPFKSVTINPFKTLESCNFVPLTVHELCIHALHPQGGRDIVNNEQTGTAGVKHGVSNPRMVYGSNSSLLQLLQITITVAKSETKYKLLRNTNDGYETTKIQERERN